MASTETFNVTNSAKPIIVKDPNATLDYTWDWTDWLAEIGDVIVAYDLAVEGSLSVASSQQTTTTVSAFISGGDLGETQTARCRITTEGGRIDDRSLWLKIRER